MVLQVLRVLQQVLQAFLELQVLQEQVVHLVQRVL